MIVTAVVPAPKPESPAKGVSLHHLRLQTPGTPAGIFSKLPHLSACALQSLPITCSPRAEAHVGAENGAWCEGAWGLVSI